MDDTNVNPRQKRVLELINRANGISRLEVKNKLQSEFLSSTATIARDLAFLLKNNYVKSSGGSRSTKYYPLSTNPLLRYLDAKKYFDLDPDLRPNAKRAFDFGVFENLSNLFTTEEVSNLNKIGKGYSKETESLDQSILKKELERFTIELSWKSSKIEGNTYSLLDTETLIKQGIPAAGHSKDEATMILNHKAAFASILKTMTEFKKLSISQITQLHNLMVKDLEVPTGIRKQAVGITGTAYQPPGNQWQIKEALEKFVLAVNKTKFPLEKALVTLAMISYIQPFADGNKRTARMLANALLLGSDFYPLSYRSVDETTYKKALIIFYEQNSLYLLKEIVVTQYKFALETYFR